MSDRRGTATLAIGALACIACCLWPFAIAAALGGITGFLLSPVGWLVVAGAIALAVVAVWRRTRRRPDPVPVELSEPRDHARR